ncbi:MAG TPA: Ech hydrogenase subunit EchB [Ruminococcaceae bacterium]|nr:Ech hydrogenase subunit EchB [Oscillospiraceae bacterium]
MTYRILSSVLYIVLAPVVGGLLAGIDRKITARLQGRRGPSVLQPFYDLFKLLQKETLIVNDVQNLFVLGFFLFIGFTGALFFFAGDLLLVFFALTLAGIFLVLSASSVNSPFSSMGSQRELMQMMAYEPMVLLVAVGFYMVTGTFSIAGIIKTDISPIVYLPGVFAGFLFILTIKLRKSPFDLSTSHHAHQEMVKGITTEASGRILAVIELAHWYENVFLMGVIALFVINSAWWSWLAALAVVAVSYFIEILIDNTYGRIKWEVMLKSAWFFTAAAGVINILILSFFR